ncbi:MAG: hypothetical protein RIC56_05535 [Pseudomonadales bacterium]
MRIWTCFAEAASPGPRVPRRPAPGRGLARAGLAVGVLAVGVLAGGGVRAAELEIAHCRFPEAPVVPDGADASESEMGQAGAEVREYVSGVQSSLECLSAAETAMGDEITEEQQAQVVAIYNQGVDQMNAVAQRYNEQVRAFKER